jgi:hypothetical protein
MAQMELDYENFMECDFTTWANVLMHTEILESY